MFRRQAGRLPANEPTPGGEPPVGTVAEPPAQKESAHTLRVFLNYRRDDSAGHAGRLYDDLTERSQDYDIFMDIDKLEPGVEFDQAIDRALDHCDVVLALIGRHWLTIADAEGQRRLDNPDDYVRLELQAALERGTRLIPVRVQGADMPSSAQLPEPLRALARRHAVEISDTRWRHDVENLAGYLERLSTMRREEAEAEVERERRAQEEAEEQRRAQEEAQRADRLRRERELEEQRSAELAAASEEKAARERAERQAAERKAREEDERRRAESAAAGAAAAREREERARREREAQAREQRRRQEAERHRAELQPTEEAAERREAAAPWRPPRRLLVAAGVVLLAAVVTGAVFAVSGGGEEDALPPTSLAEPRVSGTARAGNVLEAGRGTWSNDPTAFAFQWHRCRPGEGCRPIGGARSSTYRLQEGDVGRTLRVAVTASNPDGSVRRVSRATDVVAAPLRKPANASRPTLSGTARAGQKLTARRGTWRGTGPIAFAYVWKRCRDGTGNCDVIPGATRATYGLTSADVDHRMVVEVRASNRVGKTTSSSPPTSAVRAAPSPTPTPDPTPEPTPDPPDPDPGPVCPPDCIRP